MNTSNKGGLTEAAKARAFKPTVLVVDDDAASAIFVAAVLENDGFTVRIAHNAAEGLALLAHHQIGAVISDYWMPGMNGGVFLEHVWRNYPHTARIMLSGESSFDAVGDSINRGAISQFLAKPVQAVTLRTILNQVLE